MSEIKFCFSCFHPQHPFSPDVATPISPICEKSKFFSSFRGYLVEDAEMASAVALLDEEDKAGWALLDRLVRSHDISTASHPPPDAPRAEGGGPPPGGWGLGWVGFGVWDWVWDEV